MDDELGEDLEISSRRVKVCINGDLESGKELQLMPSWDISQVLVAAARRLGVCGATTVYNSDGIEVDDASLLDPGDIIFISDGEPFIAPAGGRGKGGARQPRRGHPRNARARKDGTAANLGVIGGYRVGRVLGEGGFGAVRLGVHSVTGEQVAMKFLNKGGAMSAGDADRIATEIACLSELQHPNVIRLIRVLNEPDFIIIVLDFAPGGDLKGFLRNQPHGRLPEAAAREKFQQILKGVAAAHARKIIHRDLKLENVLLASDGTCRITDFGLSAYAKPGEVARSAGGSLYYLTPESLRGMPSPGSATDCWCLGVMLYALLVGHVPFRSPTLQALEDKLRADHAAAFQARCAAAAAAAAVGPGDERPVLQRAGSSDATSGSSQPPSTWDTPRGGGGEPSSALTSVAQELGQGQAARPAPAALSGGPNGAALHILPGLLLRSPSFTPSPSTQAGGGPGKGGLKRRDSEVAVLPSLSPPALSPPQGPGAGGGGGGLPGPPHALLPGNRTLSSRHLSTGAADDGGSHGGSPSPTHAAKGALSAWGSGAGASSISPASVDASAAEHPSPSGRSSVDGRSPSHAHHHHHHHAGAPASLSAAPPVRGAAAVPAPLVITPRDYEAEAERAATDLDAVIKEVHKAILAGRYVLPDAVPHAAADLIRRLLNPDPMRRANLQDVLCHPWITATSASSMLAAGGTPIVLASSGGQAGAGAARARGSSTASGLHRYTEEAEPARAGAAAAGGAAQALASDEPLPHGGGALPLLQRHASRTGPPPRRLSVGDAHGDPAAAAVAAASGHSGSGTLGSTLAGGGLMSPAFRVNSPAVSGGGGLRVAPAGGSIWRPNTPRTVSDAGAGAIPHSGSLGGASVAPARVGRGSLTGGTAATSSTGAFPMAPPSFSLLLSPKPHHGSGASEALGGVASVVAHARRASDAAGDHNPHPLAGGGGSGGSVSLGGAVASGPRTATAGAPRRTGSSSNLAATAGPAASSAGAASYQRSPSSLSGDAAHHVQLPAMVLPHAHGGGSGISPTPRASFTAGNGGVRGIAIATNVSAPIGPAPTTRPSLLTFGALHGSSSSQGGTASPAVSGHGTATPVPGGAGSAEGSSNLRRQPSLLSNQSSLLHHQQQQQPLGAFESPPQTPELASPLVTASPAPGGHARSLRHASVASGGAGDAAGSASPSPRPPLQRSGSGTARGGGAGSAWPASLLAPGSAVIAAAAGTVAPLHAGAERSNTGGMLAPADAGADAGFSTAHASDSTMAVASGGGAGTGPRAKPRLLSQQQGSVAGGWGAHASHVSSPLSRNRDRTESADSASPPEQQPQQLRDGSVSPSRQRPASGGGSALRFAVLPPISSEDAAGGGGAAAGDTGPDPLASTELSSTGGSGSSPPAGGASASTTARGDDRSPPHRRGSGDRGNPLTFESLSALLPPPRFTAPSGPSGSADTTPTAPSFSERDGADGGIGDGGSLHLQPVARTRGLSETMLGATGGQSPFAGLRDALPSPALSMSGRFNVTGGTLNASMFAVAMGGGGREGDDAPGTPAASATTAAPASGTFADRSSLAVSAVSSASGSATTTQP